MSSRNEILSLLREEGAFLSGQELSRRLGLSRAAVWKAVDALRREGYEIEARSGLGYRLAAGVSWGRRRWWAGSCAALGSWTPPITT